MNPLEQKARSSFIKGFVAALLIGILASVILGYRLYDLKQQEKERLKALVRVAVMAQDITSNTIIEESMITIKTVDRSTVPADAVKSQSEISNYYLRDSQGNAIETKISDDGRVYYEITIDSQPYEVDITVEGKAYINQLAADGSYTRVELPLQQEPYINKIDLKKNMVVTPSMFTSYSEKTTDDLRTEEFSMISLPYDLKDGDTVDLRLRLVNGADYVVLSKKKVRIPITEDGYAPSTIQLKLTEDEILILNAAIVDAYRIEGCKFYALKYTDPGMQSAAAVTYVPTDTIRALISNNPNVALEAKQALTSQFQQNTKEGSNFRIPFDAAAALTEEEDQRTAVISGTQKETGTEQQLRESYLGTLTVESTEGQQ
jgi:hypothetical protein